MALSFLYLAFVRLLQLLPLLRRDSDELAIEVVVLRHEVGVLRRQVARPTLRPSDRALFAGLSRLASRSRQGRFFVQPETLLRWHRDLVRRGWTLWVSNNSFEAPTSDSSVLVSATNMWEIEMNSVGNRFWPRRRRARSGEFCR